MKTVSNIEQNVKIGSDHEHNVTTASDSEHVMPRVTSPEHVIPKVTSPDTRISSNTDTVKDADPQTVISSTVRVKDSNIVVEDSSKSEPESETKTTCDENKNEPEVSSSTDALSADLKREGIVVTTGNIIKDGNSSNKEVVGDSLKNINSNVTKSSVQFSLGKSMLRRFMPRSINTKKSERKVRNEEESPRDHSPTVMVENREEEELEKLEFHIIF